MSKTTVRASAVTKALGALAYQQEALTTAGALTAHVYVDYRLTPESFPPHTQQGAVILRFTRQQPTDQWQLDDHQFIAIH